MHAGFYKTVNCLKIHDAEQTRASSLQRTVAERIQAVVN